MSSHDNAGSPPAIPPQRKALRIELRKVNYNARLSEETAAFSADVWIDGIKAGQASNHGHGGATRITPHTLSVQLDEYGKTLPVETIAGNPPFVLQPDGEWVIGKALNDFILLRDMKRALRNRAVYTKSDRPGLFQTRVLKPAQLQQALTSAEIRQSWKVGVFLNTVPEAEAFRLYREQGAG